MKILTSTAFLLLPFLLLSCKKDESLSPPKDSEAVSIAIQLPQDIEVLPLGVMYRSDVCHKERTKGNGERYKEPGYHFTKFTLKQDGDSNIYRFPVPFDGGGACHWKLSNVTLDMQYIKEKFGEGIDDTVGSGIIIIFDDNAPQRDDGRYESVSGDLIITKDYFPWVNEIFLNGYSRDIWLYGGRLYFNYKTKNTHNVFFVPISHSKYITRSVGVKVKDVKNHTQFTYPDGTVVADGSSFPNYEKLLSLIKK